MLLPVAGYPCNEAFVRLGGGEPTRMPVDGRKGYQPSAEIVVDNWTSGSVGVLLATPSNSTGAMIEQGQLEGINDRVSKREGFVMVDEIIRCLSMNQTWTKYLKAVSLSILV